MTKKLDDYFETAKKSVSTNNPINNEMSINILSMSDKQKYTYSKIGVNSVKPFFLKMIYGLVVMVVGAVIYLFIDDYETAEKNKALFEKYKYSTAELFFKDKNMNEIILDSAQKSEKIGDKYISFFQGIKTISEAIKKDIEFNNNLAMNNLSDSCYKWIYRRNYYEINSDDVTPDSLYFSFDNRVFGNWDFSGYVIYGIKVNKCLANRDCQYYMRVVGLSNNDFSRFLRFYEDKIKNYIDINQAKAIAYLPKEQFFDSLNYIEKKVFTNSKSFEIVNYTRLFICLFQKLTFTLPDYIEPDNDIYLELKELPALGIRISGDTVYIPYDEIWQQGTNWTYNFYRNKLDKYNYPKDIQDNIYLKKDLRIKGYFNNKDGAIGFLHVHNKYEKENNDTNCGIFITTNSYYYNNNDKKINKFRLQPLNINLAPDNPKSPAYLSDIKNCKKRNDVQKLINEISTKIDNNRWSSFIERINKSENNPISLFKPDKYRDSLKLLLKILYYEDELLSAQIQFNNIVNVTFNHPVSLRLPEKQQSNDDDILTIKMSYLKTEQLIDALPLRYSNKLKITDNEALEYLQNTVLISAGDNNKVQNIQNFEIFPNPAETNVKIKFEILKDDFVQISLFDENGKFVTEIMSYEKIAQGVYEKLIKLDKLYTGRYFIMIQSASGSKILREFLKI